MVEGLFLCSNLSLLIPILKLQYFDHIFLQYYYEPGTGQKFRSLAAVRKYLAEMEDNSPLSAVLEEIKENNLPLSKAFRLSSPIKVEFTYDCHLLFVQ